MNQCRLDFPLWTNAYKKDKARVELVISLLTNEALDWASLLVEQDHPILAKWDTFPRALATLFTDSHGTHTIEAALQRLCQASGSAAMSEAHFQCLEADMAWNKPAQLHQFCLGLSKDIKDELTHVSISFIELCLPINNRINEQQVKRKRIPSHTQALLTIPAKGPLSEHTQVYKAQSQIHPSKWEC